MMKKNYVLSLLFTIGCIAATLAQGPITTVAETPNSNDNSWFYAIAVNPQKQIWAGSENGKLYYREKGKWIPVSVAGVSLGEIRTIAFDNKKGTWIGSYDKGLFYRDSAGVWTTYSKTTTGGLSDWVKEIKVAKNGKVFVATTKELLEFDGAKWNKYNITSSAPKKTLSNSIQDIIEDSKHNIWVLDAKGGLHKIGLDGTWFSIDLVKELFDNAAFQQIEIDSKDKIFLLTNSSIYTIAWDNTEQKYNYKEALNAVGYPYGNPIFDRKGTLWMSGILNAEGLNWYDGKTVQNFKYKNDNLPNQISEIVLDPFADNKIWVCGTTREIFEVTTGPATGVNAKELMLDSFLKAFTANETLQVTWSGNYTAQNITIFDTMGRVILQQSIPDAQQEAQISIPKLSKGIYLLQLNTKQGTQTIKISI